MTQAVAVDREVHRPAPARHRKFPLGALVLLTALAITLAGIFPFRQMIAQQRQVDQTQARLDSLLVENGVLEDTVVALNAAPEIERLAREQYGLVRPGETGYTVESSESPVVAEFVPVVEEEIDDRTLLERFWDFLTGRDLVPDE